MWVFTKDGFFSAVFDKYCNRGELMIRARSKYDLRQLSKKLKGFSDDSDIIELEHADYRYRMKMPKHAWAEYLSNCALKVDYPNVKDHIIPARERLRENAYYKVWTALYQWQSMSKQD